MQNYNVLMMGHKICFHEKIWIIIPKLSVTPSCLKYYLLYSFNSAIKYHLKIKGMNLSENLKSKEFAPFGRI